MSVISKLKAVLTLDNKQFEKGLKDSGKQTKTLGVGMAKLGGIIGAAFSVREVYQFTKQMGELYPKVRNVTNAFNEFADTNMLDDLREATGGMVSDLELMQKTVQARNFGIPIQQLASYFEFATIRAAQTGEEVDYLVNSIITGIGRKSGLVLDNLGISLTDLQAEIAKVGDFATAAGNIITRESAKNTTQIAEITSGTVQLEKSWENYKNFLSQSGIGKWFDDLAKSAADALDSISRMPGDIELTGKTMQELITMQTIWFANSQADMQAYGEVSAFTARQIERIQKAMAEIANPKQATASIQRLGNITAIPVIGEKDESVEGITQGFTDEAIDSIFMGAEAYKELALEVGNAYAEMAKIPTAMGEVETKVLDLSGAISQSLAGALTLMADSLGRIIGGDTEGAMASFISGIAGLMKQFGALLIAWGVAQLAIKASAANPYVAIAAGAALVAIGGLMSAKGSQITGSGYYGGGSGSYAGGTYSGGGGYDNNRELVLVARGDDLVAVINRNNFRYGVNG